MCSMCVQLSSFKATTNLCIHATQLIIHHRCVYDVFDKSAAVQHDDISMFQIRLSYCLTLYQDTAN